MEMLFGLGFSQCSGQKAGHILAAIFSSMMPTLGLFTVHSLG